MLKACGLHRTPVADSLDYSRIRRITHGMRIFTIYVQGYLPTSQNRCLPFLGFELCYSHRARPQLALIAALRGPRILFSNARS